MPEIDKIDSTKLATRLTESANKVVRFLESKIQADGSYGTEAQDISCYFKSPMMFIAAGKNDVARNILKYIKSAFMTQDGDFLTSSTSKSNNQAYVEYWSYTNGWIVRAANQLRMDDIRIPGAAYLAQYNLGEKIGFATNDIRKDTGVTDVLTLAHHGLINLEMGNLELAVSVGNYLCQSFNKQPNLQSGFYLRFDKLGKVVTDFPEAMIPFNFVSTTTPNQLHFMIGYPSAYLAILYKKTRNTEFLRAAKSYLDFSLSCDSSVYTCNYSHKIAWAASLIYECTGEDKYLTIIEKITDNFISKQQNGMWFTEDINSSYDQSAEIACWFLEISKNIIPSAKKINVQQTKSPVTQVHGVCSQ